MQTLAIHADVSDEQIQELAGLGTGFSPVFDSVTNGVPVTVWTERMKNRTSGKRSMKTEGRLPGAALPPFFRYCLPLSKGLYVNSRFHNSRKNSGAGLLRS